MYLYCPWCQSTFGLAAPFDGQERVLAICVPCCKKIASGELKLVPAGLPPDTALIEPGRVLDAINAAGGRPQRS